MADKVRVGVIGTSWWVDMMYVPSLNSHPGAEVVAVCGRNAERAGVIAAKFGGARVFADYREMIAAGGLDAVVIAAPDDLHREMVARRGRCRPACALREAARQYARRRRRDAAARRRCGRDEHGALHLALAAALALPQAPRRHRLYRPLPPGAFRLHRGHRLQPRATSGASTGGGARGIAGDLGSHMIDMAHWFLGDVATVSADLEGVRRPVGGSRSAAASGQRRLPHRARHAERRAGADRRRAR